MYDIILFDLDDTLLDFSRSEDLSLKDIHQQFYSHVAFDEFERSYKKINTDLWARVGASENALTPGEVKLMRFEKLNTQSGCSVDENVIAQAYEAGLGEHAHWYPDAKSVVNFLHQKGHILGIVTNGLVSVQTRKYERHNLGTWFDCYTVSDAVGHAKPQKAIFDCALETIAAKRNQPLEKIRSSSILMIGDTLSSDGYGAMQSGMDFCFINHKQVENKHSDLVIKHNIYSVVELPAALGYEEEYRLFLNENPFRFLSSGVQPKVLEQAIGYEAGPSQPA